MELNLSDIGQWLMHHKGCDKEGILLWHDRTESVAATASSEDTVSGSVIGGLITTIHAKLKHNILAFWRSDSAHRGGHLEQPAGVIVMERGAVQFSSQNPELPYPFAVMFPSGEEYHFSAFSEEEREDWTQKLCLASREILQIQIDSINDRVVCEGAKVGNKASPKVDEQLASAVFTNWHKVSFDFVTDDSRGSNQVTRCQEWLAESKLSIVLPLQLLKLYVNDSESLCDDLESSLTYLPTKWDCLRLAVVRHLSSNVDLYKRAANFLEEFSVAGPFFKQSIRKEMTSFAFAPTNFHLHRFSVSEREIDGVSRWHNVDFFTSGTCCAVPLKFSEGGAVKIRSKFLRLLSDPETVDGCTESKFWSRRSVILAITKRVSILRREVAEVFGSELSYDSNKTNGFLQNVKGLVKMMQDFVAGFPKFKEAFDSLSEFFSAEAEPLLNGKTVRPGGFCIPESYEYQISEIAALHVSLITKVSTLNQLVFEKKKNGSSSGDPSEEDEFAGWVEDAGSVASKMVESVTIHAKCLNEAHLFRLILCLASAGPPFMDLHYNFQFRCDILLSQALSMTCTGILSYLWLVETDSECTQVDEKVGHLSSEWPSVPLLLTVTSYLSCFGDEKGMLEDAVEAWRLIRTVCRFRLVRAFSSLKSCIPVIEGNRSELIVSLPVPEFVFNSLAVEMRAGELFQVFPVVWNVGINQDAMFARTVGDNSLERSINSHSVDDFRAYLTMKASVACNRMGFSETDNNSTKLAQAEFLLSEMSEIVAKGSKSPDVNTKILRLASEATRYLDGLNLICCKSGKDRTAMAVTLEEGRILRETKGFLESEANEAVKRLRTEGVRRINCSKNIGLPIFAFTALQAQFMPAMYRPPPGTYGSSQT